MQINSVLGTWSLCLGAAEEDFSITNKQEECRRMGIVDKRESMRKITD